MVTPVSQVTQAIPVSTVTKAKEAKPETEAPSGTEEGSTKVTLSAAGQAAAAAVEEATETAAQTAQEASKGDLQAKRLEARHAAAKA